MGGDQSKIKRALDIKHALEKVTEKIGEVKVKRMASRRMSTASASTGIVEATIAFYLNILLQIHLPVYLEDSMLLF